jgi:large subunit ribosomal protein L19
MAEDKKTKESAMDKWADLVPGKTVRIYQKIKELNVKGEEKERSQYYEGIIIARKHGREAGATITVRKVTDGVGVEKIFPLNLPTIEKIVVKKEAQVRRAKLYYLRDYKKKLKEKTVAA